MNSLFNEWPEILALGFFLTLALAVHIALGILFSPKLLFKRYEVD